MEALRALPADEPAGSPLADLGPKVREGFTSEDPAWLRDLIDGLERDGLALVAGDQPSLRCRAREAPKLVPGCVCLDRGGPAGDQVLAIRRGPSGGQSFTDTGRWSWYPRHAQHSDFSAIPRSALGASR